MEESRESSFLASLYEDVNKIQTSMVIKYLIEWIETAHIFILVEEDAFCNAHLMHNESSFDFSSDVKVTELMKSTQDEETKLEIELDIVAGMVVNFVYKG